jgi:low affinity Fe/Cu permease
MITKAIYAFADAMARPASFVILTAGFMVAAVAGITMDLGEGYMTYVNLGISIITMAIGQAVLVSSSRDNIAMHVKLDDIIENHPGSDEAVAAEKEDEETLKQMKTEIEEKAK